MFQIGQTPMPEPNPLIVWADNDYVAQTGPLMGLSPIEQVIFLGQDSRCDAPVATRYMSATTKSTNEKKMARNLHQTYTAIFLSSMCTFQATQTAARTSAFNMPVHQTHKRTSETPRHRRCEQSCLVSLLVGTKGGSLPHWRRLRNCGGSPPDAIWKDE
jgi:hypothetical protein